MMEQESKEILPIQEPPNNTDIMRIIELSTKNKGKIQRHNFEHCRTECNVEVTTFVWTIADFWDTYNFINTLTSPKISLRTQYVFIKMRTDKEHDKLCFFIDSTEFRPPKCLKYNVCIQSTKGTALQTNWKTFYLNNDLLYEVCIKTLCLNETTYLPNNTLSVHFMFQSYTDVSHNIMFEYIDTSEFTKNTEEKIRLTQKLIEATNNFASNKTNSFVTFVVDGKRLRINKSLICAASSVINNILKKCNSKKNEKEEIEIIDTTYDIFKFVIYYIETKGLFELNLDADNSTHENTLLNLISVANKFDINGLKIMCEEHIIKYVTKENVLKYLDFAISSNAVYLMNYAKKLIRLHLDDIINTTEFLEKIKNNSKILSDILKKEFETKYHVFLNNDYS